MLVKVVWFHRVIDLFHFYELYCRPYQVIVSLKQMHANIVSKRVYAVTNRKGMSFNVAEGLQNKGFSIKMYPFKKLNFEYLTLMSLSIISTDIRNLKI